MEKRRIGDLFVEKKVISLEDKNRILEHAHLNGKSFGEAGLELGMLKREDMIRVFGPSFEIDFFYLDPEYFPVATVKALSIEEILRYGAMPLGFKKKSGFLSKNKYLNVGFLNPANKAAVQAVESLVIRRLENENVTSVKIFLIIADQFVDVLRSVYGKDDAYIEGQNPADLEPLLRNYFGR